ncbi:hypothetical protein AACH10_02465 [Ideonella sp. DXS22W]|uniref:Hemerythrin-like domain-containing protein n=1 Tax=Pseudaquabacterium inlustre TaxID=2984192 RepID=A0ABU9CB44_9BURK
MPSHPEFDADGAAPPARTDPYAHAHKALRHALAALLLRLGTLDAHDDAQVQAALRELQAVLALAATHRRLADGQLHPALAERQPPACHAADGCGTPPARTAETTAPGDPAHEIARLTALADSAGRCHHPARRAELLDRLYRAYAGHAAALLQQLALEQESQLPRFHVLFSDTELQALQRRATADLPRWERLDLLLRLADGLNPDELAALLLARRDDGAPEAWLAGAMAVQGRVGATRWDAIAARLQAAGALPPAR